MFLIFTVRKRSLRSLCFYTCLCVHRGVSRPEPREEIGGLARGSKGTGLGGCPGPELGEVSRPRPRPRPRGSPGSGGWSPGLGPGGVYPNMHLPKRTATAVDGTHPTGMHSCFFFCLSLPILCSEFLTIRNLFSDKRDCFQQIPYREQLKNLALLCGTLLYKFPDHIYLCACVKCILWFLIVNQESFPIPLRGE